MNEECSKWYHAALTSDGMNVEAIASIAANYFYSDQPEVAIRLYRLAVCFFLYKIIHDKISFYLFDFLASDMCLFKFENHHPNQCFQSSKE